MKLDFVRTICRWEIQRQDRLKVEKQFEKFTGLIHIAETHIPYPKWQYVEDMLSYAEKYKGKKMLVLSDSLNLDMFSRFYQTSNCRTTPSQEIDILIKFLKQAEKVYDHIIILISNHESRLSKVILNHIQSREVSEEIIKRLETLQDIINLNKLGKVICVEHYFIQIGDTICAHIEHNSGVPVTALRNILIYLTPRIEKAWRVCWQAHTHCQSKLTIDGKLMIESGALCGTLDYWRTGKVSGKGKMSTTGWGFGELVQGHALLNTCGFHISAWESFL